MMQPIFFPFTHLRANDIKILSSLFRSTVFFPAATPEEFKESFKHIGEIDFLSPVYADNEGFKKALQKVKEYRAWGELNQDSKVSLKTFLQETPYLTDNDGVSHIRAGITQNKTKPDSVEVEEISLTKNLMFLRLAKIYDEENENLYNQFCQVEQNELKLFSDIKGFDLDTDDYDEKNIQNKQIKTNDLGSYMTSQRISSWVDFFNKNKPFNSFDLPLLFVTTSTAVMEYLMSNATNIIKLLDNDNLKVHEQKCGNKEQWLNTFNEFVEHLVISREQALDGFIERDDNCALEVKIKLYLLQGDVISSFFKGIGKTVPVCFISV